MLHVAQGTRPVQVRRSRHLMSNGLDPRNGPSLLLNGADIFTCVVGQSHRHGFLGTAWNITTMCLFVPWSKYWLYANPWVYELEERYMNQISTSMADLEQIHSNHGPSKHPVEHGVHKIASCSKPFGYTRKALSFWPFTPHYPYPPDNKRWAVGMQVTAGMQTAGPQPLATGGRRCIVCIQVHNADARHPRHLLCWRQHRAVRAL
jgi:hypothetical protein